MIGILLHESIAGMAVVIDAVFFFQLLNVVEIGDGVRAGHTVAETLERVEKRLFEAAGETHPLVLGQIA